MQTNYWKTTQIHVLVLALPSENCQRDKCCKGGAKSSSSRQEWAIIYKLKDGLLSLKQLRCLYY